MATEKKTLTGVERAQALERLRGEIKLKVAFECQICGGEFEQEMELPSEDGDELLEEVMGLVEEMIDEAGIRYDTSTVYGSIGLMCGDCHQHKDDQQYHDENYF